MRGESVETSPFPRGAKRNVAKRSYGGVWGSLGVWLRLCEDLGASDFAWKPTWLEGSFEFPRHLFQRPNPSRTHPYRMPPSSALKMFPFEGWHDACRAGRAVRRTACPAGAVPAGPFGHGCRGFCPDCTAREAQRCCKRTGQYASDHPECLLIIAQQYNLANRG